MRSLSLVRRSRGLWLVSTILVLALAGEGGALAAHEVSHTGTIGAWSITDTAGSPGVRCVYEGAAGSWYLQKVKVPAPTIYGTSSHLRSVGYRLLLQYKTASGWVTSQKGPLISGPASTSTAATLTGSNIVRNPGLSPNGRKYRVELKLIWYRANASVQGIAYVLVDHLRRGYDGSVGATCKGQVPTGIGG